MRPDGRILLSALGFLFAGAAPENAQGGFRCPAIAPMPRDMRIETRYAGRSTDPTFSTYDEDKVEQQKPERRKFDGPVTRINALSSQYLAERDGARRGAIAECLARHFQALPAAQAMEGADTAEDNYYRDWMVSSLAISYLRAKNALDKTPGAGDVYSWFSRMAGGIRDFYDPRRAQRGLDNHQYWGAAAVAAVGRVNDDADATAWARDVLIGALGEVDADGVLAAEARRGRKALHYHVTSIVPLSAVAILTGTDPAAVSGDGFSRLAHRIVSDVEDPKGGLLGARSRQPQDPVQKGQLSLVAPLIRDDPALAGRIAALAAGQRAVSYFLGGDLGFLISLAGSSERSRGESPPARR